MGGVRGLPHERGHSRLHCWVAENFGGEGIQAGAGLPGVERQAGFSAGLFEESDAVPSALDRYLREQQAATGAKADQQAVSSNFYLVWANGLGRREDAQGDLQFLGLSPRHRREARVVESCAPSAFRDGAIERAHGEDISDAASESAPVIESRKGAARFGQVRVGRDE